MARVWFSGLETGDLAEWDSTNFGGFIESTTVRTGAYSVRFGATSAANYRYAITSLSKTTLYFRGYFYATAAPSARVDIAGFVAGTNAFELDVLISDGTGCRVAVLSTGVSPTIDQTGTQYLTLNAWNLIEAKLVISATVGILETRINGVTDLSLTAQNTGTSNIGRVWFGASDRLYGSNIFWDDCSIDDAAYPGPGRIIARQPITGGTPTYNQYTKSTGTDGGALWDNTPFTTTDFCSDATSGHAQTGVISAFSATQSGHGAETVGASDTVNGCKVWQVAKTSATTSSGALASIRRRVNGVDTDTAITLTIADAYYETAIFTTTAANLDLLEAGALHGSSTRTHTIEDVGVIVDYTPSTVIVNKLIQCNQSITRSYFW